MKKKKYIPVIGIILVILIIAGIFMKSQKEEEAQAIVFEQSKEIALDESLTLTSVGAYSGPFVEDGSDESVENVLMITIKNNGTKTLQYAEIQLVFEDITAEFALSTLRPDESVIVLEKNRLEYFEKKELSRYSINHVVYFAVEPNLCEEQLDVSILDGAFNIKNISGKDLTGNIAVYYKNRQDNRYLGGITYSVVLEGGIGKNEIKQVRADHFTLDKSEVMFVSYTEME